MKDSNYSDLNFEFMMKLTNESERGAVLIGASKVEIFLEDLIRALLPSVEKRYTSKLLSYPGPLSSFSGKIELCFAFRIIDERVYKSLTALRKIRNDAAHSNEIFSLKKLNKVMEEIYDFEDGFPRVVHERSFTLLSNWKKGVAKQSLIDQNFDLEEIGFEQLWKETLVDPDTNDTFQEHLRVWKLAFGLTLLCLKLEVIKDEWLVKMT